MATLTTTVSKTGKNSARDVTAGAFFWLSSFYVVYCARPEDWVPGLQHVPLAKISAIFTILGLASILGRTTRRLKDLPRESNYLLLLILLLFVGAPFSPTWRGGAILRTLDFSKVYVVWVLTFLLVTTIQRLRRLVFIQAGCVALVSAISVLKGSSSPRLEGVLNGIYSNPNDLAFAIVLSFPLILVLLLTSRSAVGKLAWSGAMLIMMYALFRTASRAGFIDLLISGPIALWFFAVKGRRPQLIVITALAGTLLMVFAGRHLQERFTAISGSNIQNSLEQKAYGSFEERKWIMQQALSGMARYPLTGVGTGDFPSYSGHWKQVHMSYLQIGVEGGIPVLILYLLFFRSGFRNLKKLKQLTALDDEAALFRGAFYSSLVGFVVGACFAPEAYQFFPFFTVAYTSALLATVREGKLAQADVASGRRNSGFRGIYGNYGKLGPVTVVR